MTRKFNVDSKNKGIDKTIKVTENANLVDCINQYCSEEVIKGWYCENCKSSENKTIKKMSIHEHLEKNIGLCKFTSRYSQKRQLPGRHDQGEPSHKQDCGMLQPHEEQPHLQQHYQTIL